jgi:crotonobetainyl-CoA:carnitine CoA-transferase CaiB-like acyl-CoA transferase
MAGPLSGLRVVDFSRVLAGPLCARTLLDLGADVIKIEPPAPDVSRFAFPSKEGMSGYYAQQNAGKRNVSIDLNKPGGINLALQLCDTADIVVENFRAGTLGFFGLSYAKLAERNPKVIYASITGYGQTGPWRGRMAYAPTVQAEAGFTENSVRHYGAALTEPRTDGLSHADVYTGLQATIAILAALQERGRTGKGQYIDIAMAATLLAVNERAHVDLSDEDLGAEPAVLGATDSAFFVGPDGEQFVTATSIVGSRTFPSWMRATRRPDLIDDPRFSSAASRNFAQSDWSHHWGLIQEVPDRHGGTYRLPGRPWHFSDSELTPIGPPAFQGEHNGIVFAELGIPEEEIARLTGAGTLLSKKPQI